MLIQLHVVKQKCPAHLHVYTVKPVLKGHLWDKEKVTF